MKTRHPILHTSSPDSAAPSDRSAVEILEARIAPATLYAIDNANNLIQFDSATPQTIADSDAITNLEGGLGETVVGMDFRAADRQLYILTNDGFTGRIYTLELGTGVADFVSELNVSLTGTSFGVDFNPIVDRLRIVSDADQNLRVNVNTGASTQDTALNPADPTVTGAAYTNTHASAATTQLFGIDTATDTLVLQNPPNGGTLAAVGALGVDASAVNGFDIVTEGAKAVNTAFAALTVGGVSSLYTINLTTGAATAVNTIGTGTVPLIGLAAAPAPIAGNSFTFRDVDGDLVVVKTTKGTFSDANFVFGAPGLGGSQLELLSITANAFEGAAISITATRGPLGGDGYVNVGVIDAEDNDLKSVAVDGDLRRIEVGDDTGTGDKPALGSLTVQSMGVFGQTTAGSFLGTSSDFNGSVGKITIKTNLTEVDLDVDGDLGTLTVGGSFFGGNDFGSGSVFVEGDLKSAKIGGNLEAGEGDESARLEAGGNIGSVSVRGSLYGDGVFSANISSEGTIGSVSIGGSLFGNEDFSGAIFAQFIKSATVRGSLIGGDGEETGGIFADDGMGKITVIGDLYGGEGDESGTIDSGGDLASVFIGGSLYGDDGRFSGSIYTGGNGDAGKMGNITVIGDVFGGDDVNGIISDSTIGSIKIGGDLGGAYIIAEGLLTPTKQTAALAIKAITIAGSAVDSAILVGYNINGDPSNADVALGSLTVKGDWVGSNLSVGVEDNDGDFSFGDDGDSLFNNGEQASIIAKIASITIGGMVYASVGGSDAYGFVAEEIGKFKVGSTVLPLTAASAPPDNLLIGPTGDVRVREYRPTMF